MPSTDKREKYNDEEERKMWEFLLQQLKKRNRDAWAPCGNKLWTKAERLKLTGHPAQSMRDHFRRKMYQHLENGMEFIPLGLKEREFLRRTLKKPPPSSANSTLEEDDDDNDDDVQFVIDESSDANERSISPKSPPKKKRRRAVISSDIEESDNQFLFFGQPRKSIIRKRTEETLVVDKDASAGTHGSLASRATTSRADLSARNTSTPRSVHGETENDDGNQQDKEVIQLDDEEIRQKEEEHLQHENHQEEEQRQEDESPQEEEEQQHEEEGNQQEEEKNMSSTMNSLESGKEQGSFISDQPLKLELAARRDGTPPPLQASSAQYTLMEAQWSQQSEEDTPAAPLAVVTDDAQVSPNESFESASAISPRFRQFIVEVEPDVENRQEFENKLTFLKQLSDVYGVDCRSLIEVMNQLRSERSQVDLMTIEVALWKKKRGRNQQ